MQIAHLGQVSESASQDTGSLTAQLGLGCGVGEVEGKGQGEELAGQPDAARVGWEAEIMYLPRASQPAALSAGVPRTHLVETMAAPSSDADLTRLRRNPSISRFL